MVTVSVGVPVFVSAIVTPANGVGVIAFCVIDVECVPVIVGTAILKLPLNYLR